MSRMATTPANIAEDDSYLRIHSTMRCGNNLVGNKLTYFEMKDKQRTTNK